MKKNIGVSLILCTYNNARIFKSTLGYIGKLNGLGQLFEIVIVNNNSSDETEKVVEDSPLREHLVYVYEKEQGLSRARNAGLRAASGQLIVFTDDDIKPCTNWIELYWKTFCTSSDLLFMGGPVQSYFEGTGPNDDLLKFAPPSVRGFDLGPRPYLLKEKETFISANWACPREALERVGGFDVSKGLNPASGRVMVGEETDLMMRLKAIGYKALYLPEAKIHHYVPQEKCSYKHILDRVKAHGYQMADIVSVESNIPKFFGIPRWIFRDLVRLWVKKKWSDLKGKENIDTTFEYERTKSMVKGLWEKKEVSAHWLNK